MPKRLPRPPGRPRPPRAPPGPPRLPRSSALPSPRGLRGSCASELPHELALEMEEPLKRRMGPARVGMLSMWDVSLGRGGEWWNCAVSWVTWCVVLLMLCSEKGKRGCGEWLYACDL